MRRRRRRLRRRGRKILDPTDTDQAVPDALPGSHISDGSRSGQSCYAHPVSPRGWGGWLLLV
eukprot:6510944-Pyramimonas_sp.AAC.1